MKVSVIVPIYNGERTLRRCLDSVLAQTLADWECVVVNDGSTDGTSAILKTYTDSRFRVLNVPNGGVSAAKNRGLEAASGAWIAFLDCDDTLAPDALARLVEAAETTGADFAAGQTSIEDEQGRPLPQSPVFPENRAIQALTPAEAAAIVFRGAPFGGYLHAKLLRAELARAYRYAADVYIYEDMLYLLTALSAAHRVAYVPERLHHYIVAGGALAAPLSEHKASSLQACERMLLLAQERFPQVVPQARLFAVRNAIWFAQEYCDSPSALRKQPWAIAARREAVATASLPCDTHALPRVQRLFLQALRVGWSSFAALYRLTYRPVKRLTESGSPPPAQP